MSQTAWTIVTVVAVAALVGVGLLLSRLHRRLRALDAAFLAPQLRFQYTKEEMFAAVTKIGQDGHRILKTFGWWFLPMLAACALAMAVVAHNAATIRWMRWAMYALTAAGCAAGVWETLCLEFGKIKAASILGRVKWAFFAVWTVGMFAGLFIRSWAL